MNVYGWASVDKIRGEHGTNMGEARVGKGLFFLGKVSFFWEEKILLHPIFWVGGLPKEKNEGLF